MFDCHHACGGEAGPDKGDVVVMVTDSHLAHGRVANCSDNDEAVLTSDDKNGGHESHLTNLNMKHQRLNLCLTNC